MKIEIRKKYWNFICDDSKTLKFEAFCYKEKSCTGCGLDSLYEINKSSSLEDNKFLFKSGVILLLFEIED